MSKLGKNLLKTFAKSCEFVWGFQRKFVLNFPFSVFISKWKGGAGKSIILKKNSLKSSHYVLIVGLVKLSAWNVLNKIKFDTFRQPFHSQDSQDTPDTPGIPDAQDTCRLTTVNVLNNDHHQQTQPKTQSQKREQQHHALLFTSKFLLRAFTLYLRSTHFRCEYWNNMKFLFPFTLLDPFSASLCQGLCWEVLKTALPAITLQGQQN